MNWFFRVYRVIGILSIDVALGAGVSAWFLSRILRVQLLPQGILVLTISVWIIYTIDHLFDASRVKSAAASDRHRFHQQNFLILLLCVAVALAIDLVLIFFVRTSVVLSGFYLSLIVVGYIFFSSRLQYLKELAGASLYTAGVAFPSLAIQEYRLTYNEHVMILLFGLVALINIVLFSLLSYEHDCADGQRSITTLLGLHKVKAILIVLLVIFGLLLVSTSAFLRERLVLALMAMVLAMIFAFSGKVKNTDALRWIGDAVFLFPLVLFLL